jgi:hypothetical protein
MSPVASLMKKGLAAWVAQSVRFINMAKEPAPAPEVVQESAGHHHGEALPTMTRSSRSDHWTVAALVLIALLSLTLVLVTMRSINRSGESWCGDCVATIDNVALIAGNCPT